MPVLHEDPHGSSELPAHELLREVPQSVDRVLARRPVSTRYRGPVRSPDHPDVRVSDLILVDFPDLLGVVSVDCSELEWVRLDVEQGRLNLVKGTRTRARRWGNASTAPRVRNDT